MPFVYGSLQLQSFSLCFFALVVAATAIHHSYTTAREKCSERKKKKVSPTAQLLLFQFSLSFFPYLRSDHFSLIEKVEVGRIERKRGLPLNLLK
jgi:hypothetical protein